MAVKEQKDYKDGSVVNVADGCKSTMELSGSNVLRYEMADGTSLIVRPSGTEPKVKVYILPTAPTRRSATERWPSTPPGPRASKTEKTGRTPGPLLWSGPGQLVERAVPQGVPAPAGGGIKLDHIISGGRVSGKWRLSRR